MQEGRLVVQLPSNTDSRQSFAGNAKQLKVRRPAQAIGKVKYSS